MIKSHKVLIIAAFLTFVGLSFCMEKHSYVPPNGFVPDKKTASQIAEAVLIPIYGKNVIEKEKPFIVKLEKEIWIVNGVLPPGMLGGVAEVEIAKKDGCILRVSHGK